MARQLSGLSKNDLVEFVYSWCVLADNPRFPYITKDILKREKKEVLEKIRRDILSKKGRRNQVLKELARAFVDPLVEADRQKVIDIVFIFCQNNQLGVSREKLSEKNSDVLYTMRAAIQNNNLSYVKRMLRIYF